MEKNNGLRELTRNIAEFPLRKFAFENFCSRNEREKKSFFLGQICTYLPNATNGFSVTAHAQLIFEKLLASCIRRFI